MSAVFRHPEHVAITTSDSWDLRTQLTDTLNWLERPGNAALVRGWLLDIGMNSRLGNGVAVQGEEISLSVMRRLVENDNELFLSIYPPFVD